MKRRAIFTAIALTLTLLAHYQPAKAISCDKRALSYCYQNCQRVFTVEPLIASCCTGCLIACYASGAS